MRFIKWLKEGYIDAIKKLWEAHKWVFHKPLWGTLFIFPYLVGEVLIVYLVISLGKGWFKISCHILGFFHVS